MRFFKRRTKPVEPMGVFDTTPVKPDKKKRKQDESAGLFDTGRNVSHGRRVPLSLQGIGHNLLRHPFRYTALGMLSGLGLVIADGIVGFRGDGLVSVLGVLLFVGTGLGYCPMVLIYNYFKWEAAQPDPWADLFTPAPTPAQQNFDDEEDDETLLTNSAPTGRWSPSKRFTPTQKIPAAYP